MTSAGYKQPWTPTAHLLLLPVEAPTTARLEPLAPITAPSKDCQTLPSLDDLKVPRACVIFDHHLRRSRRQNSHFWIRP